MRDLFRASRVRMSPPSYRVPASAQICPLVRSMMFHNIIRLPVSRKTEFHLLFGATVNVQGIISRFLGI